MFRNKSIPQFIFLIIFGTLGIGLPFVVASSLSKISSVDKQKNFSTNRIYSVSVVITDALDAKVYNSTEDISKLKNTKIKYIGTPVTQSVIEVYNSSKEVVTTSENIIFRLTPHVLDMNSKTKLYQIKTNKTVFICDIASDSCATAII